MERRRCSWVDGARSWLRLRPGGAVLTAFVVSMAVIPACLTVNLPVTVVVKVSGMGSGEVFSPAPALSLRCTVTSGVVSPDPCEDRFLDRGGRGRFAVLARPAPGSRLEEFEAFGLSNGASASCTGSTCDLTFGELGSTPTNSAFEIVVRFTPSPAARVEITPSSSTTVVGGTVTLSAQSWDASDVPINGRSYAWSSSDELVATVTPTNSGGPVESTGVSPGTVTITASAGSAEGTATVVIDPPPALPPVFLQDDFTVGDEWSATVVVMDGGATAAVENRASGGLVGGYRHMTHELPAPGAVRVEHIFRGATYDPSVEGAIDHLNYSEARIVVDPPFPNAAVGSAFYVLQGGVVYAAPVADVSIFRHVTWEVAEVRGLGPSDFTPAGLDFSDGGAQMAFGFGRSNSTTGAGGLVAQHGIDSWVVEIVRVQP